MKKLLPLILIVVFFALGFLIFRSLPKDLVQINKWDTYSNEKWDFSFEYPTHKFIYCDTHKTSNVVAFFRKDLYSECPNELTEETISHFNMIVMDKYQDSTQDATVLDVQELLIENKLGTIAMHEVAEEKSVTDENIYYLAELPLGEKKLSIIWLSSDLESFQEILNSLSFTNTK